MTRLSRDGSAKTWSSFDMAKDVGMLFADALAQTIAEGRKTVTRRPITKSNCHRIEFWNSHIDGDVGGFADLDWDAHLVAAQGRPEPRGASPCSERCRGRDYCCTFIDGDSSHGGAYLHVPGVGGETRQRVFCRWDPGDLLVVRECFTTDGRRVWYRAATDPSDGIKWSPSIHMPRRAARNVRRIVDVRPELCGPDSLDAEEARREGFDRPAAFAETWARIYGVKPRWVWRVEFEDKNR